jgi:hypothetical protein
MPHAVDHGHRITGEEYDRRVVALQEAQPAMPTAAQDREMRRRELELRIDHCLGESFPARRREELWQVAEDLDRHRLRYGLRTLWRRLTKRPTPGDASLLADSVAEVYAVVLSPEELRAFLGLAEGETPSLPEAESR